MECTDTFLTECEVDKGHGGVGLFSCNHEIAACSCRYSFVVLYTQLMTVQTEAVLVRSSLAVEQDMELDPGISALFSGSLQSLAGKLVPTCSTRKVAPAPPVDVKRDL